jgi:DNA-binding MarR family transcriptional regulator
VGDLATFIGHLSHCLDLESNQQPRSSVPLTEAARRLNVSSRTLQRYRQRGLVCHYLVFPDGVKRLACFEDALQRFVQQHREHVARAAAFTRVGDDVLDSMINAARETQRRRGLSLNATARRLALRYGRSHETLRGILKQHDRKSVEPIFDDGGAIKTREARIICRAARMGMSPSALARRLGRTTPTVHRAINVGRRQQLDAFGLDWVPLSALADDESASALLCDPAITTGLIPLEASVDVLQIVKSTRLGADMDHDDADAATLLAGFNMLKRRAAEAVGVLPRYPASSVLDAIETDLRWATLLKRRVVGLSLPAAVAAIEQFVGRPLEQQPREEVLVQVRLAIDVVAATVESINPDRGQRTSHVCAYAMNRALAAGTGPPSAGRAGTKHRPEGVVLRRPFETLCPWQLALGLRADLRAFVETLPMPSRRFVTDRFGLGGSRPCSLAEIAERTGSTTTAVTRLLAGAMKQLRRQANAGG